jgi:hypothetical protein
VRAVADQLLKLAEVAARLHVSDRQVRRFLGDPTDPLPFVRLGSRSRRVESTELELWVRRHRKVRPTPEAGLFAGFSPDARTALEGLFLHPKCTRTGENPSRIRP